MAKPNLEKISIMEIEEYMSGFLGHDEFMPKMDFNGFIVLMARLGVVNAAKIDWEAGDGED